MDGCSNIILGPLRIQWGAVEGLWQNCVQCFRALVWVAISLTNRIFHVCHCNKTQWPRNYEFSFRSIISHRKFHWFKMHLIVWDWICSRVASLFHVLCMCPLKLCADFLHFHHLERSRNILSRTFTTVAVQCSFRWRAAQTRECLQSLFAYVSFVV